MTSDMPDGVTGKELETQVRRQSLYLYIEQVLVATLIPVGMAIVCAPLVLMGWISGVSVVMFLGAGAAMFILGSALAVWQSRLLSQEVSQVE